jgi:caa(3)-type oxidase subunit IV
MSEAFHSGSEDHASHDEHDSHDWGKHKKTYALVGAALFFFTFVTVALGIFHPFDIGMPGPSLGDYVIGLMIAAVKSLLVALIFMHLNHEKGLIYKTLVFTFVFVLGLMVLTVWADHDPILEQYETLETTHGLLMDKL